jgi:hypothetical protein
MKTIDFSGVNGCDSPVEKGRANAKLAYAYRTMRKDKEFTNEQLKEMSQSARLGVETEAEAIAVIEQFFDIV